MSLLAARSAFGWRAAQQAGVQFIYFARLLILARLLAPEAFGLLAVAMIALSVLMSLSDLGIMPALVQRERADRDEYDAAWTVALLRAVAIAVLLATGAPLIAQLFDQPEATRLIQLLALRPVIEALGSIGTVRMIREFRFREMSMIHVPGALVDAVTAIALAPVLGVWALVGGALAGAAAITGLSYIMAPHRPRLLFDFAAAAPLIRFGRWVLGTSILGLLATSGVQLVISRRLGVAELGLYFLATRIAFLPADAMRTVVGSVSFPLYASLRDSMRSTASTFRSLLSAQAVVLFPVYALLIVLAPSLAEALGPRWAGTTPLIRIIGAAAAIGLYVDTILPLLLGRGHPERVMAVVAVQTFVLLAIMVPFVSAFGVAGAAAAWLPAYGCALATSLMFARREIGAPLAGAGQTLLLLLMIAAAAGAVASTAQAWSTGVTALAAGILLGVLTAAVLVRMLSRITDIGLGELVRPRALGTAQ